MPTHISKETNTHEERSNPQKFAALVKSFWSMTLAKKATKPKNPKKKQQKENVQKTGSLKFQTCRRRRSLGDHKKLKRTQLK